MSSPLWRIKRLRRPSSGDLPGDQPETVTEQEQGEDRDRKRNSYRQRLYGAVVRPVITNQKEQPGEQVPDHGKQHEDDDELEH